MKALVLEKNYPLNVTSGNTFNLNNRDWTLLDGKINSETNSLSTIYLLFPPGGTNNRDYSILYSLKCASDIPGQPEAVIEDYFGTPVTGRLNSSTDKFVGFPANTFKMADFSFSPSNIYGNIFVQTSIYPYIHQGSQFWNETYAFYTIRPNFKIPVITDITIVGTDPRQIITVNWTADIQDLVDVEIWQGGIKKATLTGTTARTINVPANTITAGEYTVKIIAANNPIDDLGVTGTAQANFTAVIPAPTVTNVAVNQTEIRKPIVVSWQSTNQTDYIVEFIQNETVRAILTGGTQLSATLNPNILSEGLTTARVTVRNTANGISTTAVQELNFTATLGKPVITSLEPDGINQNINSPIIVTWNATAQETYTLVVRQLGQVLQTYNGTTAQTLTLPANLAKNGNISLELTCRNTVNGTVATSTRTATFLGFGKPETPVFENVDIYNVAQPTFNWTSVGQVAYEFSILQNESVIETSGTVTSTAKSYTTTQILSNNNIYTLKLRIKNQYDLWSDYAIKNISVSYTPLSKPTLSLVSADGAILVNGECANEMGFSKAEVWRKDQYSNFVRIGVNFGKIISINDTVIASNVEYFYKIRAYSDDGGVIESDIKSASAVVKYVGIEDIVTKQRFDLKYLINLDFETIVDIQFKNYAGVKKPRVHRGETEYQIANVAVAKDKIDELGLRNMLLNADVLLLRDRKGTMIFCSLSSTFKATGRQNVTYNDLEFQLTETEFLLKDIYDGGRKLILTYFDGTWAFDGTINFSGTHVTD